MKNKQRKIKIITSAFSAVILSVSLIVSSFSPLVSAAGQPDVKVTDKDNDGTISIGDEFCLDNECFYVLSYNDGILKALAKYNLHVGGETFDVTGQPDFTNISGSYQQGVNTFLHGYYFCNWDDNDSSPNSSVKTATVCYKSYDHPTIFLEFPADAEIVGMTEDDFWDYYDGIVSTEDNDLYSCYYDTNEAFVITKFYGCAYMDDAITDTATQDSNAISAHGDERGRPVYPTVGDVYLNEGRYDEQNNIIIKERYAQNYRNYSLSGINDEMLSYYLFNYLNTLQTTYTVDDINLLTFNQLVDVLNRINTVDAEFAENDFYAEDLLTWEEHTNPEDCIHSYAYWAASLLDYIPDQYKWLYSSTYWLGTTFYTFPNPDNMSIDDDGTVYDWHNMNYQFFIDTLGDLCSVDGSCGEMSIGAGVRPVITINTQTNPRRFVLVKSTDPTNPNTSDESGKYLMLSGAILFAGFIIVNLLKRRR